MANKSQQAKKKEKFLPHPQWLVEKILEAEMDRDPFVKALMRNYAAFEDSSIAKQIWRRIEPKLTEKALKPDPFAPNPHGAEVDGDIRLGKVRNSDAFFGLNLEELVEHTLITGRAGSGKTTIIYLILEQLLKNGIPFMAFDFKQDYRHLAKAMGGPEFLVFNWETFRFNPLRPPKGVTPKIWMQAFTNVFSQAYWLLSSRAMILHHIEKLYKDYGVFSGEDVYPTMHDLLESIKSDKRGRKLGRIYNYLDSAETRLIECLLSLDTTFNCDQGFPIEDLLTKNVVFELEGLLSDNQSFFITLLLRYIFQYRISNNQRTGLQHVLLFDEAKSVYDEKKEFTKELGPSEIAQFTSEIREFGEGLVLADQMPTELGRSIKANVYTVICMSQSGGPNVFEMAKALGLKKEQAEVCRILKSDKYAKVFEAIVKINGRWLNPFVIQVTYHPIKKDVTNEDVKEFMTPILTKMNEEVIPRTEYRAILDVKQREEERREAEARQKRREEAGQREAVERATLNEILLNIRKYPFKEQKERITMLDLGSSSSTTDKLFKELEATGLVNRHEISFGRGRGHKVFYEITEEGMEHAGMDDAEVPGSGSFLHRFWQHTIKNYFESKGFKAEIEKRYGIKNVDVGVDMNGKKVAVEVELSPKNLKKNIERDFQEGCELIIVAVKSKRALKEFKEKISYYNEERLRKIQFRVVTDFLPGKEDKKKPRPG